MHETFFYFISLDGSACIDSAWLWIRLATWNEHWTTINDDDDVMIKTNNNLLHIFLLFGQGFFAFHLSFSF